MHETDGPALVVILSCLAGQIDLHSGANFAEFDTNAVSFLVMFE